MTAGVVATGGAAELVSDTALATILAAKARHHAPQQPQVLRRRAVLEPTGVFPEDDVQHPVQPILDPPVSPAGAAQFLGAAPATADVLSYLERFLPAFPLGPHHPGDGLQVHP